MPPAPPLYCFIVRFVYLTRLHIGSSVVSLFFYVDGHNCEYILIRSFSECFPPPVHVLQLYKRCTSAWGLGELISRHTLKREGSSLGPCDTFSTRSSLEGWGRCKNSMVLCGHPRIRTPREAFCWHGASGGPALLRKPSAVVFANYISGTVRSSDRPRVREGGIYLASFLVF